MSAEEKAKKPKTPRAKITKETHPQLSQRLPRETGALIAPAGDGLTILERAMLWLGERVKETRKGFFLDGRPASTRDVVTAAGLKFADES